MAAIEVVKLTDAPDNDEQETPYIALVRSIYDSLEEPIDPARLIKAIEDALDRRLQDAPKRLRIEALQTIANIHRRGYKASGIKSCINVAIHLRGQALAELKNNDEDMPFVLGHLGRDFMYRFEMSQSRDDIQSAIRMFKGAQSASAKSSCSSQPIYMYHLGVAFQKLYNESMSLQDLDCGIESFEKALDLTEDRVRKASLLHCLGNSFHGRYKSTRAREDLEKARTFFQTIIDEVPQAPSLQARILLEFAKVYRSAYEDCIALADQENYFSRLLESFPAKKEAPLPRFENLETRLVCLGREVDLLRKSLAFAPEEQALRQELMIGLAIAQARKYLLTQSNEDFKVAVKSGHDALHVSPKNHPDNSSVERYLAEVHKLAHSTTVNDDDLGTIPEGYETPLEKNILDGVNNQHWLLFIFAGRSHLFELKGLSVDVEKAIYIAHQRLSMKSIDMDMRQWLLRFLGYGYMSRYLEVGAEADLHAANRGFMRSLELSESPITKALSHAALGTAMTLYHQFRTEGLKMLEESVKLLQAQKYQHTAPVLGQLGMAYMGYHGYINDPVYMDKGLSTLSSALRIGKPGSVLQGCLLSRLSLAYAERYLQTRNSLDIANSLQHVREALKHTQREHPYRGEVLHLNHLVTGIAVGEQLAINIELENSIDLLEEAVDLTASGPWQRLENGVLLFRKHAWEHSLDLASEVAKKSVRLVPLLSPHSLQNSDKQRSIRSTAVGLASDAASLVFLAKENALIAVELLELGRGVMQTSMRITRADISELEKWHPEFAREFKMLQDQLDSPASTASREALSQALNYEADKRHRAGKRLDELLPQIRQLPRFERFLLSPSENDIKAAAKSGPIVIINISRFQCQALIIEPEEIKPLWLPRLHLYEIEAYARDLEKGHIDISLLEWLWKVIVKPVLMVLGFDQQPEDHWPRIRWIPTGPLTRFPIHAAGLHFQDGARNTLMNRAISTYSTSIQALMESRRAQNNADIPKTGHAATIVGMQKGLPYVEAELQRTTNFCNAMQLHPSTPQPLVAPVLECVKTCDIFHFAGHGKTDLLDPLKSGLKLEDGYLTVENLFDTNLRVRQPFLAYLSACGTGEVRDEALFDESLHLIAAFQLAGFRNVIGTLWKVDDQACVEIATDVYEWMRQRGLNADMLSEGLHHACRRLRDRWVDTCNSSRGDEARDISAMELEGGAPLHWIPYVLYGE